jgi:hypothetical protein
MVNKEIGFRIEMPRTVMIFEPTLNSMLGQLVLEPELPCGENSKILAAAWKCANIWL